MYVTNFPVWFDLFCHFILQTFIWLNNQIIDKENILTNFVCFLFSIWHVLFFFTRYQGIYDGMTRDEIKKMDPEEHKVIEEHPFNYRYPRGEVMRPFRYKFLPPSLPLTMWHLPLFRSNQVFQVCLPRWFYSNDSSVLPYFKHDR